MWVCGEDHAQGGGQVPSGVTRTEADFAPGWFARSSFRCGAHVDDDVLVIGPEHPRHERGSINAARSSGRKTMRELFDRA
jgi:hypothetical protein